MEGETVGALDMQVPQLTAILSPTEAHSPKSLDMQWDVPSSEDYANVVAAFSVILDPSSSQPVVRWAEENERANPSSPEQFWESKLDLNELEEGLAFRLGADAMDTLHHVPDAVRDQFAEILQKYRASVFQNREFPPFPPERDVTFRIQLQEGAQIPASPVHKLSPALVEQLRKMLQELLHDGLIIPSTSPFAAPLLMVKKPDGSYRICIDYRKLNAVTVKDRYPLPNPSMIFDKLAGFTYFSKLDLR
jgi:hypothetical protein